MGEKAAANFAPYLLVASLPKMFGARDDAITAKNQASRDAAEMVSASGKALQAQTEARDQRLNAEASAAQIESQYKRKRSLKAGGSGKGGTILTNFGADESQTLSSTSILG